MKQHSNAMRNTGPVVIKLGGLAVEEPTRAEPLLRAIIALHTSEPEGVVIVHGGGRAIDGWLERLGCPIVRAEGLRITPPDQIDVVVAVLAGIVNKRLVAALASLGALPVGLCLGDGALTTADRLHAPGADLGLVGTVTGGKPTLLRRLLADGYIPVLSPIATGANGELLNVNADHAAAAITSILGARMLVLLTDVPGVLDAKGALIDSIDTKGIERLIAEGVIHGGMIPKVRAATIASARAQSPVLIASWSDPGKLANLSNGESTGTLIIAPGVEAASVHLGQGMGS